MNHPLPVKGVSNVNIISFSGRTAVQEPPKCEPSNGVPKFVTVRQNYWATFAVKDSLTCFINRIVVSGFVERASELFFEFVNTLLYFLQILRYRFSGLCIGEYS